MKDACGSAEALGRRYDAMGKFLLGLFSSEGKTDTAARAGDSYADVNRASMLPTVGPSKGCSILTIGLPVVNAFNFIGIIMFLFGSCDTTAVGSTGPSRDEGEQDANHAVVEDPFSTMNGFGDRVY